MEQFSIIIKVELIERATPLPIPEGVGRKVLLGRSRSHREQESGD